MASPPPQTLASDDSDLEGSEAPISEGRGDFVDAKTAALLLGVKLQTLYAYVSRGLIRVKSTDGKRGNMYLRRDLEALRGGAGPVSVSPAPATEGADYLTRWSAGTILPTAVTSITADGPRYRGKLATTIASRRMRFEDCVNLLWSGVLSPDSSPWDPPLLPDGFTDFTTWLAHSARRSCSRQLLAQLVGAYAVAVGRNPEAIFGAPNLAGRQILQILAPGIGLLREEPGYTPITTRASLAEVIAAGAGISPSDDNLHAINCCLILSADHELAPSTFAARVAASAAADIFACVTSGLGTFEGPMTGLGCDEPERILIAARTPAQYVAALRAAQARQEPLLGYNHPVYPSGDPRATYLLDLARDLASTKSARLRLDCIDAASREMGLAPSLAIGLIAVSTALRLPDESAGMLMALGRVSGWIAHILEQRLTGTLILPRTRYIGASG